MLSRYKFRDNRRPTVAEVLLQSIIVRKNTLCMILSIICVQFRIPCVYHRISNTLSEAEWQHAEIYRYVYSHMALKFIFCVLKCFTIYIHSSLFCNNNNHEHICTAQSKQSSDAPVRAAQQVCHVFGKRSASQRWSSNICWQRIPDDYAGDREVSGCEYRPRCPDDKHPGYLQISGVISRTILTLS